MRDVVMPQMGESLSEGTVARWLKRVGDSVDTDEPLVEIATDKVDTEIPSPAKGVLDQVLVAEGQTVAIGAVLARIRDAEAREPVPEPDAETAASQGGHFQSSHEPILYKRSPEPADSSRQNRRSGPRLSPAVRGLIKKHAITHEELEEILAKGGSGHEGRINRSDIERYVATRDSRGATALAGGASPLPAALVYRPSPEDRLEPLGEVRKQIGENLLASRAMSAQVTSFTECNVHRLVRHIEEHGQEFEAHEGYRLTLTPFIADAVVRGLKQFPIFNASVVGDDIAFKRQVHLGIALALEQGLVVPVIRNADDLSFIGLARTLHHVTRRAIAGEIDPDSEVQASFTITAPGQFGGTMGTPMLIAPQVAIIALGSVSKKPVVVEDAIAVRPVMMIALSFDHRIIDGITAYQFIEWVRVHIEEFDLS